MNIKFYLIFLIALILGITIGFGMFKLVPPKLASESVKAEGYILSQMGVCHSSSNKTACIKEAATDFINKFSLSEIMTVYQNNEQKEELISSCHESSHYLGRQAYQTLGSVSNVFAQCNHSCLGGCFHGAVEGYFIEQNLSKEAGNDQVMAEHVVKICGQEGDYQKPQTHTECFHGLGHALMFLTENDLLRALNLCDGLSLEEHRELCYTGSFMANVDGAGSADHPSKYYDGNDPFYPCKISGAKYQRICYTYAVTQAFQADLPKSINLCSQMPSDYRYECYRTLGRDRIYETTDVSFMKGQCDSFPSEEATFACYQGLSWSLMIRYGPSSSLPADFCKLVKDEYKESCYEEMIRASMKMTRDMEELGGVCQKIQEEIYSEQCLKRVIS